MTDDAADHDPEGIPDEENPEWTAADFARARLFAEVFPEIAAPSKRVAMSDQAHDQPTEAEAITIRRLEVLTGRPAEDIIRQITGNRAAWSRFQVAVTLATEVWDYLPGDGDAWAMDPAKQERQFRSYAAMLFTEDA